MANDPTGTGNPAEFWDEMYHSGQFPPAATPSKLLSEWIDALPAGRALDVGAGIGLNTSVLVDAGFTVDAIDVSIEALSRARERVDSDAVT